MHETSNCLEHRRLKDIVFLQSNLRLRQTPLHLLISLPTIHTHTSLERKIVTEFFSLISIYREQKNREQGPVDPISYENIELVKDWVSEKELCSEEPSSSDWMAVDPPLGNTVLFAPAVDDFEALGAGNHGFHY